MSSNAVSLPPSSVELNLLLEWPDQRTGPKWVLILAASVALHVVFFTFAIRVPSLIGRRLPEHQIVVHKIPLYLPPDLMTQKARNTVRPAKQIDLADLQASAKIPAHAPTPPPNIRHFEVPKDVPKPTPKAATPQILPQAPTVAVNQSPSASTPLPGTLPAVAPPPKASAGPFQNIDEAPAPVLHPKLAPPKTGVQAVINGLAQSPHNQQLSITDDVPEEPSLRPGSLPQPPAQHAAVELQSDPNGADFRAYLREILTIVRANWRRVIPESARLGMLRGRTTVEFVISKDGSIPKLVTADSSGSEPLDRAAVAGLSMSNPLPPLPADYKGLQVRLAFTFAYNQPAK